jgi:single-strand DNA-binding protein
MAQNGLNKVFLQGNLATDAEMRYTQTGKPVVSMRLITNESFYNGTTKQRESRTEGHMVVGWGKRFEALHGKECLLKGQGLTIIGRLQTRSYKHKKYEDVTQYVTEVIVGRDDSDFILNGSPRGSRGPEAPPPTDEDAPNPPPVASDKDRKPGTPTNDQDDFAD